MFGGNPGTRRQDFDVKTKFVRFDVGDKIRPRFPVRVRSPTSPMTAPCRVMMRA